MTVVRETAYPRFIPELSERELAEIYTPTASGLIFVRRNARSDAARLTFLVLVKTTQR
ncbi:hypothetical protein [Cupriavidus sp. CuC1]|uniref:hypothetical protein n=1 Tax=Cupriavidus sp. CuC1 TaxID=3373131 RepID=UPI0037CFC6E8